MGRLTGKNILVTGGTSGIGEASVRKLIENDASVVFCGRDSEKAATILSDLESFKDKIKYIQCDLSIKSNIEPFFSSLFSHFDVLHCAFNNVGIEGEIALFDDSTEDNWDNVFNINLKSMWRCMKFEINHMLANGGGTIINMSSTSGLVGNGFGMTAYAATKHAIIGLTKSVALEYAKHNLRAISLCPGFIETPMIDRLCHENKHYRRRFTSSHPAGRLGRPEEIANALVYLCSDETMIMTGNNFIIDGGLTV